MCVCLCSFVESEFFSLYHCRMFSICSLVESHTFTTCLHDNFTVWVSMDRTLNAPRKGLWNFFRIKTLNGENARWPTEEVECIRRWTVDVQRQLFRFFRVSGLETKLQASQTFMITFCLSVRKWTVKSIAYGIAELSERLRKKIFIFWPCVDCWRPTSGTLRSAL